MQFQCTADNPSEAAIAEYVATIISLQDRLCTASAGKRAVELELAAVTKQSEELKTKFEAAAKELAQLKGEPGAEARPHLEAVPKDGAAKEV